MDNATLKTKVDEFVKWSKLADDCKKELEILKGELQKVGEEMLADKKVKQVDLWGTNNSKVVVTESETVKVVHHVILSQLLGEVLKSYTKEEPSYKYSEPFKSILGAVCQGNYLKLSLSDAIAQIPSDENTKKVLGKKLKGNWKKDIKTLVSVAGLNQKDAEDYAYLVNEVLNYERIRQLCKAAGIDPEKPEFDAALETIKAAVIVEEGLKVGVETEDVA